MTTALSPEEKAEVWLAVDAIRRGEKPTALNFRQQEFLLDCFIGAIGTFEQMPAEEQAKVLQARRDLVSAVGRCR